MYLLNVTNSCELFVSVKISFSPCSEEKACLKVVVSCCDHLHEIEMAEIAGPEVGRRLLGDYEEAEGKNVVLTHTLPEI